jgi:hypothetical protein
LCISYKTSTRTITGIINTIIGLTSLTGSAFDIQLVRRDNPSKALKRRTTMITRRSFLIGAAGLLTYSLLDKYLSYYENHEEALIEYPKDYENTLYYDQDNDWFELGDWGDGFVPEYPEPPSWEEFIHKHTFQYIDVNSTYQINEIYQMYGISPCDYSKPCDRRRWEAHYSEEYFYRKNTPPCFAYEYLKRLNLGPDLIANDGSDYGIWFSKSAGVHGDVKAVNPICPVSASLLQKKLVELGEPTRVVLDYADL